MLSRVADSVFWLSRYIERAENIARFVDVNHNLMLDLGDAVREQWGPLVYVTGDFDVFRERYGAVTAENVLAFLTFDPEYPNSILSCLQRARENARSIRENISTGMWEEINKFYLLVRDAASARRAPEQPYEFFHQVKRASHLLLGITEATMSHGEAWHFGRLGRLIERADKTSRILDVKYFFLLPRSEDIGTPLDIVQWSALLKSASALEMYRKCHGRILPTKVADFLVLNTDFPRSMHYCLRWAEQSLQAITGGAGGSYRNRAERLLGRLRAEMDYTHIDDIIERGLHEFIDDFQIKLNQVGDSIHETFFATPALEFVAP